MATKSFHHVRPTRDGLPIHQMPGHYVRRLQQVAVRLFVEEVGGEMTPVQFAALVAAAERPGIDQAALSALIGYDRATIGGVIDRLEAKGWIARSASDEDRRVKLVSATRLGREALDHAIAAAQHAQVRLLEPFTAAERRHFERLCLKLLAHHLG